MNLCGVNFGETVTFLSTDLFFFNIVAAFESDEFMTSKKSHEVQSMSEVVACLAQHCGVNQVGQHFYRYRQYPKGIYCKKEICKNH